MTPDGTNNRFLDSFRYALDGIRVTAGGKSFRIQVAFP